MISRSTGLNYSVLIALLLFAACKKQVAVAPPAPAVATPAAAPASPTITLRADSASIQRGQSATLRWDARNATAVRIDPGLGDVSISGSRQVSPASSVTYTATAKGASGTASDTARITVNIPPPPPSVAAPTPRTPDMSAEDLLRTNVQTIYFDYDKAQIGADQISHLQDDAAWLKMHPDIRFTIEGHCDERGSEEYNMGLGDRRGNAVKDFLISEGLPASRITVISYGDERPVCRESNEDCYRSNRRAAFTLTNQ